MSALTPFVCVFVCVRVRSLACMLPQVWSQTTSNWVQARLLESSKGWCRVEHEGSGDEEWLPLASAKLRRPLLEGARDAAAVSARAAAAAAAEKKKGKGKSKGAGESSGGGAGNGGEDREKEKGASGKKDGKKRKASQEDGEAGVGGSGAGRGGGRDEKKRRKHELNYAM